MPKVPKCDVVYRFNLLLYIQSFRVVMVTAVSESVLATAVTVGVQPEWARDPSSVGR